MLRRPVPLRLRLTLIFVLAMAVVFAAVGSFLYFRTKANLDAGVDSALRARERALATLVSSGASTGQLLKQDALFEVIDARGRAIAASPSARAELRLTATERRRALRGSDRLYRGEEFRLLAERAGANRVVVVASSLRQREHALEGLATALAIGGPLALLLAAGAAYWLAGRAFGSIDAIRARAAAISRASPDERLPLHAAPEEIRVLGETLNEMLARIGASAEHERRFVADAGHQLRTPLAILKTELEVGLRDAVGEGELRQTISSALEETDRVSRLADSLLTLALADDHDLANSRERLALGPLVERVAAVYTPTVAARGRELHVNADVAFVDGDPLRLEQAIGNLIDNALLHGDGRITVTVESAPPRVRISVSDQGRGFSRAFVGRAFDRFSRAADAPRNGGSGLGLSIVAAIAAAHGGGAEIGDPAQGTEISLYLPTAASGCSDTRSIRG